MKRKLLFAIVALLCAVGSRATDWTGNAPAAGDFYLYNVGADRFLGYGANWGTRATVEHAGIPVTLAKVSDGVYTIKTNVSADGKMLNVNGYVDSDATNWTFTAVGGQTNVYQISSDGKYIFWDDTDVNYATSVNSSLPATVANSYWKLVTKAQRDDAFTAMNATELAPLDITYKYIENPNTTNFVNIYSNKNPWSGTAWTFGGYQNWADAKDQCVEHYNKTYDTYIEITGIPNGEYEFGVQGYYRDGTGAQAIQNYAEDKFTPNAKIYANSNTTNLQSIAVGQSTSKINDTDASKEISGTTYYVPNNQYMAEVYIYKGYYDWQNVKTIVTDGTLRFGVKKETTISNDWTIADKFYLSYLGPTIAAKASALPVGDMTADTWYYFDIPLDGEYDLTLTTLSDIVYTKDNTILYENESSVTANFSGTSEITLTAGRYFVKSASAQTMSVAASAYRYNVGTPTSSVANGSYQQSISTVTLTFADAATNDPGATFAILDNEAKAQLKLSGSTVAEGTLSLVGNVLTATFSTTALTLGSTYTLELDADVVGYDGQVANEAVNITINTPVIGDGVYYLYNTYTENYLSRSGNYATQAIMDNRGLAVFLAFDTEGKTVIRYFDNLLYVGIDGFCYGDAATGHQFTVSSVPGGYKFLCVSNSKYLAVYEGQVVNDAVEGDNLVGTSNIWALETPAQHEANYTRNANAQAVEAASNLPALSAITTKAALDSELSSNYNANEITITGSKDAKYQVYAGNSLALSEAEYYTETIEDLTPGLYKLSVNAFQRAAWYDWVNNAGGARGNIYLYANDAKTQIKSVMEYGANEAYSSNWESGGKNYPNDDESAYTALATGNYTNEVYVYVKDEGEGTGSLTIGINNPTRQGNGVNNGTWCVYDNWTLTRYDQTAANMTITSAKYGTFVAPFAVTIPSGVTAYTVTAVVGTTLTMDEVTTTIPANRPVVVYSESAVNEDFYGKTVSGTSTYGLLTGVYENTSAPDESYVLQNNGGKVGFYQVDTGIAEPTVGANRAYMTIGGGVKASAFFFDEATGIQNVLTGLQAGEIYDIAGRKMSKLQKGMNIVNGQKVLVK